MSELGQLFQQLINLLQDDMTIAYNTISATSLVLYEVIITFPDELRCVWQSQLSFVTALHLSIRYYTAIFLIINSYVAINTNLSARFCGPFNAFQIWGATALAPAVDILIVLRVYALYNQNKWIAAVLAFFWLAETAIIFTLTALGFGPNKAARPNPLPGVLPACFPIDPFTIPTILNAGAVVITCQGVYLGLALYKLARQLKTFRMSGSVTPLFRIFFSILAMYALNVICAKHNRRGPLQGVGEVWLISIVSITAGRLVLNLRNTSHTPENTSLFLDESHELQFATGRNNIIPPTTILDDDIPSSKPNAPSGDPLLSVLSV